MEGLYIGEGSVGGNQLRAFSKGCRRQEREHRRELQHMQDGHETRVYLDEGSSEGERTMSYIPKRSRQRDRLRALENLRKQVNYLEIELKGRRCRKDQLGLPKEL